MNRSIIFGAVLFATAANAQASQPSPEVKFTIVVTAQQLDLIGNGLGSMPFKDAAPLINSLREQVIAQTKKDEPAKALDNGEKK